MYFIYTTHSIQLNSFHFALYILQSYALQFRTNSKCCYAITHIYARLPLYVRGGGVLAFICCLRLFRKQKDIVENDDENREQRISQDKVEIESELTMMVTRTKPSSSAHHIHTQ